MTIDSHTSEEEAVEAKRIRWLAELAIDNGEGGAQLEIKDDDLRESLILNVEKQMTRAVNETIDRLKSIGYAKRAPSSLNYPEFPDSCVEAIYDAIEPYSWNKTDARTAAHAALTALKSIGYAKRSDVIAWKPIETAPHDVRALFWLDWSDECAPLNKPMKPEWQVFMGLRGCWSSVNKATHWQPLPAPPAIRSLPSQKDTENG